MFAAVTSVALVGIEPRPVRVEVHVGGGGKRFTIVGLPDAAVREAKERVKAAIVASGFVFPKHDVIVNLAPADLPKAGAAYDVPIALALLAATRQIAEGAADVVALGELALDGIVRPVIGTLGAAMVARDLGLRCLLPDGVSTATTLGGVVDVAAVATLAEAVGVALGTDAGRTLVEPHVGIDTPDDLGDVRGQTEARRALEIAAAGGHHLLMSGAPGGGKTMLARCLPSILPPLGDGAMLEVALAWSAAGLDRGGVARPPFRSPHHSATLAAVVGGGSGIPVPGQVTLAQEAVALRELAKSVPRRVPDRGRCGVREIARGGG